MYFFTVTKPRLFRMEWLNEEWNYFQSNRGVIEALRQTNRPPVLFSAVQHLSLNLREILNGFSTIIVFCCQVSLSSGFCYKVFVGSRVSILTLLCPLCWRKAALGSLHSPLPEVCCSELPFWDASGFLLMTSSSLLPDSAIRGTTKQQSKSLVRTWFTWLMRRLNFVTVLGNKNEIIRETNLSFRQEFDLTIPSRELPNIRLFYHAVWSEDIR